MTQQSSPNAAGVCSTYIIHCSPADCAVWAPCGPMGCHGQTRLAATRRQAGARQAHVGGSTSVLC